MSTTSENDLAVLISSQSAAETTRNSLGWIGLALAVVTGGSAVALSVVAAPFVAPALRKVRNFAGNYFHVCCLANSWVGVDPSGFCP